MPLIRIIPKLFTTKRQLSPSLVSIVSEKIPAQELVEVEPQFLRDNQIVRAEHGPPPLVLPKSFNQEPLIQSLSREKSMPKPSKRSCNRFSTPVWALSLIGLLFLILVGLLITFMVFSPCK
jgi:hypothetical protein